MKLQLITIKDYCKKHNISDVGARKRVKQKIVKSVILDELLYIVEESNEIDSLKHKLKLSNSKVRELKKDALLYLNQDALIRELKTKIDKLENKLDLQVEKKEELYEKVISHITTNNLIER